MLHIFSHASTLILIKLEKSLFSTKISKNVLPDMYSLTWSEEQSGTHTYFWSCLGIGHGLGHRSLGAASSPSGIRVRQTIVKEVKMGQKGKAMG